MNVVELILVMCIFVIFSAIAMPVFNATMVRQRLVGAAQKVANDLRYARSLAVNQGQVHQLHSGDDPLEGQAQQYRLELSPTGAPPWTSLTPWYSLSKDFGTNARIAIIKDGSPTFNTLYSVSFNAQGAVANAGVVNFPISVDVTTPNGTLTIQVMRTGSIVVP